MIGVTVLLGAVLAAGATDHSYRSGAVELHYRTWGAGKPVVILSGGPGFDSGYMLPVAERVGKTRRAILLDQRGTGRSKLPRLDSSTLNLAAYVADLEELRKAIKVEKLTLLGHSWGGMLAMAYAARHPNRVESLILAGSGGVDMTYMAGFGRRLRERTKPEDDQAFARLAQAGPPDDATAKKMGRLMLGPYVENKAAIDSILRYVDAGFYNPEIDATMGRELFSSYDLSKTLGAYKGPTLIVQGRQDPIGEDAVAGTRKALPQAEVVWLDKCGHFAWAERPEAFFAAVEKHLAKLK